MALFAPHQAYGGPGGMKRFVDACHARGLAVILDVVYNHLGPEGNYLSRFGPYFSWRHRTPWGKGINLDEHHASEVCQLICDNAAGWIRDYHVDGLRLDATHALADSSAIHILEQIAEAATDAGARRGIEPALIAEQLTNDPRVTRPRADHGLGMHAQWCDDFHHALHAVLTGERHGELVDFGDMGRLARCLTHGWYLDGRYSEYHKRNHGRPLAGVSRPGNTLIGNSQNHDQIGNRAHGERMHQLVGMARAKVATALSLLGPAIPMLFMGEEWAASAPFLFFSHFADRRLGRAVERGRARDLAERGFHHPPSPQAEETFRRSVLDWSELERAEARDMLAWYRALIALRKEVAALRSGEMATCRFGDNWLAMQRGDVVVGVNLGQEAALPVRGGKVVLASEPITAGSKLPSDAVVVWRGARLCSSD